MQDILFYSFVIDLTINTHTKKAFNKESNIMITYLIQVKIKLKTNMTSSLCTRKSFENCIKYVILKTKGKHAFHCNAFNHKLH